MDKEYLVNLVGAEAAEDIWQRHEAAVSALRLDHALSMAVQAAGGRSEKAIRALVNESDILASSDMAAAAASAVEGLKREHGYLFSLPAVSSPGTGTTIPARVDMNAIGKMSMAEYRKFRGK